MEKITGKIKITNKGSGTIKAGRTIYTIPREFTLDKEKHHTKVCEFELNERGTIINIWINGEPIGKNQALLAEKAEGIRAKEALSQQEEAYQEQIKATRSILKDDLFKDNDFLGPRDTILPENANVDFINFGLKLDKYAQFVDIENGFKLTTSTKTGLESIKPNFYGLYDVDFVQKHHHNLKRAFGDRLSTFSMEVASRLIVGLGQGSVYETSLTLHPIYGIPYIPGSAIKGILRSYLITKEFNAEKDSEAKAFASTDQKDSIQKKLCDIFGAPKSITFETNKKDERGNFIKESLKTYYEKAIRGDIIFFDAFPQRVKEDMIEVDVMTPHYSTYYQGKTAPVDTIDPVPIPFFTVANTSFQFELAYAPKAKTSSDPSLLNETKKLLEEALEQQGIGAKTAIGYGIFKKN